MEIHFLGDSGGPLLTADNVQVGIVSVGYGCANDIPGIYARVSNYEDWIVETACTLTETSISFCIEAVLPSAAPVQGPSASPVQTPSASPVQTPSGSPVQTPSASPVQAPSASPVQTPSVSPVETAEVSISVQQATSAPSKPFTAAPFVTATPTLNPTGEKEEEEEEEDQRKQCNYRNWFRQWLCLLFVFLCSFW